MRRLCLFILGLILVGSSSVRLFGQLVGTVPPDEVLARVGPKVVTAEEFLERLELMPWRDKELVALHDSLKAEALRSLVAEKLLALEAEERGIGTDERTTAMLGGVNRMLTKDKLYTEEVVNKSVITDAEIERGLTRYPWTLIVKGYSFPDRGSAARFAALCRKAGDLDSAVAAFGYTALKSTDTIRASYSDLYPAYEDAIYSQHRPGMTGPAFSPSEGWAVFRVLDRQKNPVWATQNPTDVRIEVKRKAKARIERERALTFAREYLQHRPMHIDSVLFAVVADSVVNIVRSDTSAMAHRLSNYVDVLRSKLGDRLHLPFARGGGSVWTLEEVLESLRYYPGEFPPQRNPRVIVYALNRFVMEAVEGEMLAAEGKRLGLDRSHAVRLQMGIWEDAWKGLAMGRDVVRQALMQEGDGRPSSDSAAIAQATRLTNVMNQHIASLAQKYGVELFEQKLRAIPISKFSMVTKHNIGFGGVLLAVPMIIPDWGWISRLSSPVVAP